MSDEEKNVQNQGAAAGERGSEGAGELDLLTEDGSSFITEDGQRIQQEEGADGQAERGGA
ncbi:MAG: hypothetical protein M3348_16030 [Acidobacteriota bacterium]|nr:hypothetical protein [Acidobacteriota bacterium]